MIKLITLYVKLITVAIATVLLTSCHSKISFDNGIDGNGNVTRQTRPVENNFSKVDVSRGLTLILEQSNTYLVEVEADENLQEHILTRVENGTLFITTDENIDEAKAKKILVKLPSLVALEASSGSLVRNNGILYGTDIAVNTTSGSEVNFLLEIDKIECKATSGSSLDVKGKALQLSTASSSGSDIDARKLLVNEVISESTSGSSTDVHPIVSLQAKATSGSSITYHSLPKTVTKEESSGGSVSKD